MITFVTFKWAPFPGYRSKFNANHVNTLAAMVARHYDGPHRFVCITDDAFGIRHELVEVYELWDEWAGIKNPSNQRNPSCYRRLRLFARNTGEWLGPRIVCLDLDTVITGPLRPMLDAVTTPFHGWGDTNPKNRYNGSFWYLEAGALPHVYEDFDPNASPAITKTAGYYGSDQAWLCHALGPGFPIWSQRDGVYSYRCDIQRSGSKALPPGARVVFFHGAVDPWSPEAQRLAWVREHYR